MDFLRLFRFDGVPSRVSIFLMPTTHCLINLMELPFFVLTLDNIELVHFERVQVLNHFYLIKLSQTNTKHFDIIFVFKDYSQKVVMISCVPMVQLDPIKDWLDSCDIKYSEGIQSLNWPKIIKTIQEDPKEFFETGGWTFLDPESDKEDDVIESEEEEAEDDYRPESSESDELLESDEEDYSVESIEEEFDEDEPSDALSWDDLEEVARKEDESRHKNRSHMSSQKRHKTPSNADRKKSRY